ncbi:MAG: DUF349 domain-containing protein, partial [Rikenellaceae bacterium]
VALVQDVDFTDEDAAVEVDESGLELETELEEDTELASSIEALTVEDVAEKSREELLEIASQLISTKPVLALRKDLELIKITFYKLSRAEYEERRKAFVDNGGVLEEFVSEKDELEIRLKELFAVYRQKRDAYLVDIEQQKDNNLKAKLQIIEELKELINSNEKINVTFATFRELQQRWKDSGIVPKNNIKDLWESYHMHVENFYNFVKINKELRDLDLKKNYEMKLEICDQAEALLLEESVVVAFNRLQKLHDGWREIGPVALEFKEQLWERFKEASTKINKIHQDYFEGLKQEQIANLALKTELCQKCEDLSQVEYQNKKEWDDASNELIEIQKVWKTIGFAPKRDNNKIYSRFRTACDLFFEKKRDHFLSLKNEMEENLQKKVAICVQAEAISQTDDWKKGTADLIALQKEWKTIGIVPRKQSDLIWKRFRTACDLFFEKKGEHFETVDKKYDDNLRAKKALIELIKEYEAPTIEEGFAKLKEFQHQWIEIGFVPIKEKDVLQKEYKELIDSKFNALRGSDNRRNLDRFKSKISSIKSEGNSRKIDSEKDRIYTKIKNIESDIVVWENNIGFFAGGKNSQKLIDDVQHKIAKAKEDIAKLREKLSVIDEL